MLDQELEDGLISIAAPVLNAAGEAVAALNVSGQAHRSNAQTMQQTMLPALRTAASTISQLLRSSARSV